MDEPFSAHPVDRLIRELLATRRAATDDEIERIVERMATAPFDPRVVRVRQEHRGLRYQGRTLGARAPSSFYHLVQRVVDERQWAVGTTLSDYLGDLWRAVRTPECRLAIFERRGGSMAAGLTPTDLVVPTQRRGLRPLRDLLVVYSADRGIIVSGYQCSGLQTVGIPEDALWLR